MNLYNIYIKDKISRQRDYSLLEYYSNNAMRSKCALRRPPEFFVIDFSQHLKIYIIYLYNHYYKINLCDFIDIIIL